MAAHTDSRHRDLTDQQWDLIGRFLPELPRRHDGRGRPWHVTATKGGRVRFVPMTARLMDALKQARSLKGRRVVCDKKGTPLT